MESRAARTSPPAAERKYLTLGLDTSPCRADLDRQCAGGRTMAIPRDKGFRAPAQACTRYATKAIAGSRAVAAAARHRGDTAAAAGGAGGPA